MQGMRKEKNDSWYFHNERSSFPFDYGLRIGEEYDYDVLVCFMHGQERFTKALGIRKKGEREKFSRTCFSLYSEIMDGKPPAKQADRIRYLHREREVRVSSF
jgi:hypothetical protein